MLHSKMSNGELKSAVIVTAFSILLLLVTTFFLCYNYDRLAQRLPPENAPADKRGGPKQEKLHPNEEVIEEYYRRVTKGKQDMPEEWDRRLENIYKKPEPEVIPFANDIRLIPGIGNNDHNGDVVIMEVEPFALPRDDFGEDDSSLESPFKIGGITIPIQAFPFGLPFNLDGGDNMIGHDDLEDEDYPDLVFPENEPLHFHPIVLNEPSSAVNQLPEEKELKPTPKPKPSGSTLLVRLFDNHPTTTVKPPTTTVKPPFGKPPPIPKPRLENNKNNPVNEILSAIEESSVEDDSDEDLRGEDMLHRLLPNNLFGPFF